MKKIQIKIITLLMLLLSITACGRGSSGNSDEIVDIVISSSTTTPVIGNKFTLYANAIKGDGTSEDISSKASWNSSDNQLATINNSGEVTPIKIGKVTFSASYEDISEQDTYTIIDIPRIDKIEVTGIKATITKGESYQLTITAVKTDKTTATDEFDSVTFTSSNDNVLTVNESGSVEAISDGDAILSVTSNDSDVTVPINVIVLPSIEGIYVEQDLYYVDLGSTSDQFIEVTAQLSNESKQPITGKVQWTYSKSDVEDNFISNISNFRIEANGKISAKEPGTYYVKPVLSGLIADNTIKIVVENSLQLVTLKDTQKGIEVSWNNKQDVINYKLLWNTNPITGEDSDGVHSEIITSGTKFALPEVDTAKTYYFRVAYQRQNSGDYSDLSPEMSVNPIKQQWQHKPGLPGLKQGAAAILYKDELFIFGGQRVNSAGELETSKVTSLFNYKTYNQPSDQENVSNIVYWKEMRAMASARTGMAACLFNDTIYIFGGTNADGSLSSEILKYDPIKNEWIYTGLAALPTGTTDLSCNTIGDKIFVIGGMDSVGISDKVYIFNPLNEAAELTLAPTLNHARYRHASAVVNKTIYVAGGISSSGIEDSVESFNTDSENNWTSIAHLQTPRSAFGLLPKGEKLFAFGGITNSSSEEMTNNVESIEVLQEKSVWKTESNMPYAVSNFCLVEKEDTFYFYGGIHNSNDLVEALPQVMHWDTSLKIWYPNFQPKLAVTDFSSALLGKNLYIIGGRESIFANNEVQAFDIDTNKWSGLIDGPRKPSTLTTERYGATTLIYKGSIFTIGGINKNGDSLKTVEIYEESQNAWTSTSDLNFPRANACAAVYNSQIFVFGGKTRDIKGNVETVNSYEVYEPASRTWIKRGDMPDSATRVGAACATFNESIYIIGGMKEKNGSLQATNAVDEYIPSKSQFLTTPANMLKIRVNPAVAVLNGSIYIFGGFNGSFDAKILETSAEQYLPHSEYAPNESNGWTNLPDMQLGFDHLEAHAFKNKILLIGSKVKSLELHQVENNIMIFE